MSEIKKTEHGNGGTAILTLMEFSFDELKTEI